MVEARVEGCDSLCHVVGNYLTVIQTARNLGTLYGAVLCHEDFVILIYVREETGNLGGVTACKELGGERLTDAVVGSLLRMLVEASTTLEGIHLETVETGGQTTDGL